MKFPLINMVYWYARTCNWVLIPFQFFFLKGGSGNEKIGEKFINLEKCNVVKDNCT